MNHRTPLRYGTVAHFFHWSTAILVLAAFIYGPGGSESRVYSVARDFDRHLHETLGLCVLMLALLRILWHLVDARPDPQSGPAWVVVDAALPRPVGGRREH